MLIGDGLGCIDVLGVVSTDVEVDSMTDSG
jgi:hypothetical protein